MKHLNELIKNLMIEAAPDKDAPADEKAYASKHYPETVERAEKAGIRNWIVLFEQENPEFFEKEQSKA